MLNFEETKMCFAVRIHIHIWVEYIVMEKTMLCYIKKQAGKHTLGIGYYVPIIHS